MTSLGTDPATRARKTLFWVAAAVALVVWTLPDIALLVGYAVLLAYALLPIVLAIESIRLPRGRRVPRGVAAAFVMITLVGIVGWAAVLFAPRIAAEGAHLVSSAPPLLSQMVRNLRSFAAARGWNGWLDPAVESLSLDSGALVRNLATALAGLAVKFLSGTGRLLGFALLPLLAFYLLAEFQEVRASALSFLPGSARPALVRLGAAVDRALASYVRGQAIVCLTMGIVVAIALSMTRHPAALLLGALVGIAELIPYIGFAVAATAIMLAGSTASWFHAVLGLAIYAVLNWIIGTFVTPRVMGRYLKLHPFIVTVSVLAGAQLLGPAGALLALPGAAVLQAVVAEMAATRSSAANEDAGT